MSDSQWLPFHLDLSGDFVLPGNLKFGCLVLPFSTVKTLVSYLGVCLIVAASCALWISGITLALVHLLELSSSAGWMIAASLGTTALVATVAILYEITHAFDLTETAGQEALKLDVWSLPYLRGRGFVPTAASGS